jgi:hypothetical protein
MTRGVVLLAMLASAVCCSREDLGPVVFRSCLATGAGATDRRVAGFGPDPRRLSRARRGGREAGRLLPGRLVQRFVPAGPRVLGVADTSERRRGKRLPAPGLSRDPVRRSPSPLGKARGLRRVSRLLWAPRPGAARPWALPLLACLAPSERYRQKHRKPPQPVLEGARPMMFQGQRWLPDRALGVVGESAFSARPGPALVRQTSPVVTR